MKVSVSTGGIFSFLPLPGTAFEPHAALREAERIEQPHETHAEQRDPEPHGNAALHIQGVDYPGHRHDHHHEADYLHHIGFHISLVLRICFPMLRARTAQNPRRTGSGPVRPSGTYQISRPSSDRIRHSETTPRRNEEKHGHDRQETGVWQAHRLLFLICFTSSRCRTFALPHFVVHHPDACKHEQ